MARICCETKLRNGSSRYLNDLNILFITFKFGDLLHSLRAIVNLDQHNLVIYHNFWELKNKESISFQQIVLKM